MTQLPRRLAKHTGCPAPTYRRCFDYAVGDRFPAGFSGNRWTVDEADLDTIAVALGPARRASDVAPSADAASTA